MQACFLLGPAGSGKTHRCLDEVRAELTRAPEGLPLVLIAPKQSTFQLERRLLADGSLPGYTRLQILSFERLAHFILEEFQPSPRLLDEQGRVMVLRALLAQKQPELKIFRAAARLPGFAQQLSLLLRELQRHQQSPEKLSTLAARSGLPASVGNKLHDFALLLRAYLDWLEEHQLQDANCLLDLATTTLRSQSASGQRASAIRFGGLWLDGFAEMTPQELDFLAALAPLCERAMLAFCLECEPKEDFSWLSTWSLVSRTFRSCYQRLASTPGCSVEIEVLRRAPGRGRFAANPVLAHLEKNWTRPKAFESSPSDPADHDTRDGCALLEESLRVAICPNPEAEAVLVAREILRHVHAGGRFRDCGVLLRTLEGYHDTLRRVFRRYEIPFFLDRREPGAHHPLAELTRYAVRLGVFGWEHDDWFGALKTGLVTAKTNKPREQEGDSIDELENEALARGWKGDAWKQPLGIADNPQLEKRLERLRREIVPPFAYLVGQLAADTVERRGRSTGFPLAAALREFWNQLSIEKTLDEWTSAQPGQPAIHATVWEQMQSWLDNLAMAFPDESLPLREWLPILEAGLAGLTVGVIPPALDQVLISTIDRSRNPELKLALVLGLNESVFPAAPQIVGLLTESDRQQLETNGVRLGPDKRAQLGHERYYGYIACTRARDRLVLTSAAQDTNDRALNPSPFLAHLKQLFPTLKFEDCSSPQHWRDAAHACELVPELIRVASFSHRDAWVDELENLPAIAPRRDQLRVLAGYAPGDSLAPTLAAQLYGPVLHTSVSALERFAACPFKFFVHSGLRAEERRRFEVDVRERGSFQHEVLRRFHEELHGEGLRWRNLTPSGAREHIGRIAAQVAAEFRDGLFQGSDESAFVARSLTGALQDFIETIVGWMEHYGFDPHKVELSFGGERAGLPAWELDLGDGRRISLHGKIDRVDLATTAAGETLCVVMDYKSSAKKIDPVLLAHGIQIQLPAYLAALRHISDLHPVSDAGRLVPAGFFYVNLRGRYQSGSSRREVLDTSDEARRRAYRHAGRFSLEALPVLDRRCQEGGSGQFNYKLTKASRPYKNSAEVLDPGEFDALLDHVENLLADMGRRIFKGEARVDPYRKGAETACDFCDCRAICRIDPWTHPFRVLKKIPPQDREP